MGDGKDDVIKRRKIASRISAQWIVAEHIFFLFFSIGYIGEVC